MESLDRKILEFLYQQVEKNNIPHIRKSMVKEFSVFISGVLAEQEAAKVVARMQQVLPSQEACDEKNS